MSEKSRHLCPGDPGQRSCSCTSSMCCPFNRLAEKCTKSSLCCPVSLLYIYYPGQPVKLVCKRFDEVTLCKACQPHLWNALSTIECTRELSIDSTCRISIVTQVDRQEAPFSE